LLKLAHFVISEMGWGYVAEFFIGLLDASVRGWANIGIVTVNAFKTGCLRF
jgi:hypothetical protein